MCESSVYDNQGNILMEDVINIKIEGRKIILADILNQEKVINGIITDMDLEKHQIIIQTD